MQNTVSDAGTFCKYCSGLFRFSNAYIQFVGNSWPEGQELQYRTLSKGILLNALCGSEDYEWFAKGENVLACVSAYIRKV
jgi:hypothetical protein